MHLDFTDEKDDLAALLLNKHSSCTQASVTCALTGKLAFDESALGGKDGQEVFSERCRIFCAAISNANANA